MTTAAERSSYRRADFRRQRTRRSAGRLAVTSPPCRCRCAPVALAFFLAPAGHLNTRAIVQVNGLTYSVTARQDLRLAGVAALLPARLDLDLTATLSPSEVRSGTPPDRRCSPLRRPRTRRRSRGCRSARRARARGHQRVTRKSLRATVTGAGNIVTLAQRGTLGCRRSSEARSAESRRRLHREPCPEHCATAHEAPEPGQKLAALTFDDGPGTHTQEVLDALAAAHVPATFFVLGSSASGSKAMIEKMRQPGTRWRTTRGATRTSRRLSDEDSAARSRAPAPWSGNQISAATVRQLQRFREGADRRDGPAARLLDGGHLD